MIIRVMVKTGARTVEVEKGDDEHFQVSVIARPEKGRANKAVIEALAAYFKVAPTRISIVSGFTGPLKKIEIL